jgi:hypothetical protein
MTLQGACEHFRGLDAEPHSFVLADFCSSRRTRTDSPGEASTRFRAGLYIAKYCAIVRISRAAVSGQWAAPRHGHVSFESTPDTLDPVDQAAFFYETQLVVQVDSLAIALPGDEFNASDFRPLADNGSQELFHELKTDSPALRVGVNGDSEVTEHVREDTRFWNTGVDLTQYRS